MHRLFSSKAETLFGRLVTVRFRRLFRGYDIGRDIRLIHLLDYTTRAKQQQ